MAVSGADDGFMYGLECPSGNRYSSWGCHSSSIRDFVPLPAVLNGGVLSVSGDTISCQATGGVSRFVITNEQVWLSSTNLLLTVNNDMLIQIISRPGVALTQSAVARLNYLLMIISRWHARPEMLLCFQSLGV